MAREYQRQSGSHYKQMIASTIKARKPIFIIKLETTGLDSEIDRICGITIIRCEYEGNQFLMKSKYSTLVNCKKPISKEVSQISGITNELIEKRGISEKQMVKEFIEFIGPSATITGFSTKYFIAPFLMELFSRNHVEPDIKYMFDMQTMAKSVIHLKEGYTIRKIIEACNCTYTAEGFVATLNKLFNLIPKGSATVDRQSLGVPKYWKKSNNVRFIFFNTAYGKVGFSLSSLYWSETDEGVFDVIDMDYLTEYLLALTNSKTLLEMSRKLEAKFSRR